MLSKNAIIDLIYPLQELILQKMFQEIRQATPFSSNAPFGGMKAMVPTRPKLLMTIVGSPTLEQQIM